MDWPSSAARRSNTSRGTTSVALPAPNGIVALITRDGQFSACAVTEKKKPERASNNRMELCIDAPFHPPAAGRSIHSGPRRRRGGIRRIILWRLAPVEHAVIALELAQADTGRFRSCGERCEQRLRGRKGRSGVQPEKLVRPVQALEAIRCVAGAWGPARGGDHDMARRTGGRVAIG